MNLPELFRGLAVIIDDEINEETSAIFRIKQEIEKKNILVATYKNVPQLELIPSLSAASFVILDWRFHAFEEGLGDERLQVPASLVEEQNKTLVEFIKALFKESFSPLFILTNEPEDNIKSVLAEQELWNSVIPHRNRIFVKSKSDAKTADAFFNLIKEWLQDMPSAYVLKEWEKVIYSAKNKMFNEMYNCSPVWTNIVWDIIKTDSPLDNHREFGGFLTRNFVNRINDYEFLEEFMEKKTSDSNEYAKILEKDHYYAYDSSNMTKIAYTGDLFVEDSEGNKKYYLNIRAQCDLMRNNNDKKYDPELYILNGRIVDINNIITEYIELRKDNKIKIPPNAEYDLLELINICKKKKEIKKINLKFKKHRVNDILFLNGSFIGKINEVIVPFVDNNKAISFNLNINIKNFCSIKEFRVGRILPPVITHIQKCSAHHIIREGLMPSPKELFD